MKIKLSIITMAVITTICTNCTKKNESYEFKTEKKINLINMNYPDIIGIGMQLIQIDSMLIVNDFHGDSLLCLFDINSNIIKKRLISKGNGPNEMISPLDVKLNNGKLYLLSRPIFTFGSISLNNLDRIQIQENTKLPPKSDCFLPLTETLFVFSGMWDKRYMLLNQKGATETEKYIEFGEYPSFWKEEEKIPNTVKAMFHQCQFAKHPTLPYFVTCSSYVLEIYRYDETGKTIPTLQFQKQLGDYEYTFTQGDVITANAKEGSSLAARGISCTNKYIYIIKDADKNSKAKDILVIDWDGKPIKKLNSEKYITCMTVDEKNKKGYCIIEDPEDQLVYFNIE